MIPIRSTILIKLLQAGEIRLEAAKAKGFMHGDMGPISDLIDPGDDDLIGSGSFDDQIDHMEARILGAKISTKPVAAPNAAVVSSTVARGAHTSTTASAALSSAVSKGGKNAYLNLKTAAAASALGLGVGYMTNRKRTRR